MEPRDGRGGGGKRIIHSRTEKEIRRRRRRQRGCGIIRERGASLKGRYVRVINVSIMRTRWRCSIVVRKEA